MKITTKGQCDRFASYKMKLRIGLRRVLNPPLQESVPAIDYSMLVILTWFRSGAPLGDLLWVRFSFLNWGNNDALGFDAATEG
jgi:hypothetical protein